MRSSYVHRTICKNALNENILCIYILRELSNKIYMKSIYVSKHGQTVPVFLLTQVLGVWHTQVWVAASGVRGCLSVGSGGYYVQDTVRGLDCWLVAAADSGLQTQQPMINYYQFDLLQITMMTCLMCQILCNLCHVILGGQKQKEWVLSVAGMGHSTDTYISRVWSFWKCTWPKPSTAPTLAVIHKPIVHLCQNGSLSNNNSVTFQHIKQW